MNLPCCRLLTILAIASVIAAGGLSTTSHAQSVNGSVINQSLWDNAAIANPPGNGTTNGFLRVGAWSGGSQIVGPPAYSNTAATGTLPFGAGATFAYSLSMGTNNGDYDVVAWIDGNADGGYNVGEPRSLAVAKTVTNAIVGVNLTVTDDSDNDGLPDWWEVHFFTDLDETAAGDPDSDGLSNFQEYQASQAYTNLVALSPANWDTDGDSMDDGWEYANYAEGTGTDPCSSDAVGDPDGDGLSNWQEYCGVDGQPPKERDTSIAGNVARVRVLDTGDAISPISIDTDNDYLIDSFEAAYCDRANGINPIAAGSYAADQDADGLSNYREQCLLVGLREGDANDLWSGGPASLPLVDGNGLRAFSTPLILTIMPLSTIESSLGAPGVANRLRGHDWTDPTYGSSYLSDLPLDDGDGWDTDRDELPDGWETESNLNPADGTGNNGTYGDPDGDELLNISEYKGQDGDRSSVLSYVNGTGDETNPNEHNWRPLSTEMEAGISRDGTIGAALPTASLGADNGKDSDDDGMDDNTEIRQEYEGLGVGSSPVHSTHPFVRRSALILNAAGIQMPDPEGAASPGYRPDMHSRNWTLECSVRLNSAGRNGYLIDIPGGPSAPAPQRPFTCRLWISNNVPVVSFYTVDGYLYKVSGLEIPTNRWTHLAGAWDPALNSLSLYVDGIFVQEQQIFEECVSSRNYYCTNAPTIGRSPDGSFVGEVQIDEVRIWNIARSQTEVEQFRTQLVPQNNMNLVAYYRFDDGGTKAEDFTRKAKHGLLGAYSQDNYFGDNGYGLSTNIAGIDYFMFITNSYADVRGVDERGADDTDGDGMPDGWETVHHLNPWSASGADGADGDPDGDGLCNIYEYWSQCNPKAKDSDQNGTFDGNEDYDNDDVVNKAEQSLGSRPDMVDTDDDGTTDGDEQADGSNPANPTDPAVSRSIMLGGSTNDYLLVPYSLDQRLTDWTIEAWVNPTNTTDGAGYIVQRIVETPVTGSNVVNFMLGVETNAGGVRPYAGYQCKDGTRYIVRGNNIPVLTWTHIAASYDHLSAKLTIFTNGVACNSLNKALKAPPTTGKGGQTFLRIGEDFKGLIDEVRIWSDARTAAEIEAAYDNVLDGSGDGLVHYFRFDDGQAVTNSGFPLFTPMFQPHGPQDFTFSSDWSQEWAHAATMHGAVQFVAGGIGMPPTLTVILNPAEVRDAGAQWAFDSGIWRSSGKFIVCEEGQHSLLFKSVSGWTAPDPETVSLTNNQNATLTRIYLQNGAVSVDIEPEAARLGGAKWQLDGGTWQESGDIVTDLSPGPHIVNFLSVTNYTTPPTQTVIVNEGATTPLTVWYAPIRGSAVIMIDPATVVSNGAQWRIDGGPWNDSGTIVSNLVFGDHTVEFLPIPPWTTPDDITLTVADDSMLTATGRYTQITGLQVVLTPPAATAAGAQWNLNGGAWQNSGTLIALSPGNYTVSFKTVANWAKPNDISVAVSNDMVSVIYASYYDLDVFGAAGTAAGQFNKPRGLAIYNRFLYVADSGNNRIQLLDTLTSLWTTMGSAGTRAGQFNQPFGVTLDPSGNLWVADAGNHRVQRLDAVTGAWSVFGSKGSAAGQFIEPFDLEADSVGNIYVVDHYNHRIQKRATSGAWSVVIGAGTNNGAVRFPNGIAIDRWDNLYVSDRDPATGVNRIQKFDKSGFFLARSGSSASSDGGFNLPRGIEAGLSTNIYVADTYNNRVQMLTPSGWAVVMDSMFLNQPEDVEIDRFDNLFIADTGNNRILRLAAEDSDGDGLPNWVESNTGMYSNVYSTGTSPTNSDSDVDGYADGRELRVGTNYPNNALVFPPSTVNDYDNDGMSDLVAYYPSTGGWRIRQSSDWSVFGGGSVYWGWSAATPVPGDYDGDGKTDVAVFWADGGNWYIRYSSGGTATFNWGWGATKPVPGDYDGDGITDAAVYWPATGTWYIRYSSGGSDAINWGWNTTTPAPGDYDGDGTTDLAVYWPAGGKWYIRYSGGGSSTISWGWSAAAAVPGDYDGDGRTDVAVFSASAGRWYIIYSSGGTASIGWGWNATVPVQGDYDGDGKTDQAVYWPAGGTWYIRCSSGGGGSQVWGGGEAVPVRYR
ncbi:MAG: LamG-like jellyroll fold domain-containing protein [bacterium]